jgi:formate C-acetyltransferase
MEDAMVNPDKHRDLMVRMGGYTEYFVNLSKEEQATLLTRTEHGE